MPEENPLKAEVSNENQLWLYNHAAKLNKVHKARRSGEVLHLFRIELKYVKHKLNLVKLKLKHVMFDLKYPEVRIKMRQIKIRIYQVQIKIHQVHMKTSQI